MKLLICTLFSFLFISYSWSQSSFSSGLLPRIRVSTKIGDNLKLVNGIESRQLLIDNTREESFDYEYVLTDLSSLLSYKLGSSSKINAGYLIRFEDNEVFHRTIQQLSWVQYADPIRFGHRFVTDQTFGNKQSPKFRTRYRLTLEKPLSGNKIDPTEWYLKLGNEYLGEWQNGEFNLEIRLLPFLGYEVSNTNKIEFGLDYRIGSLIDAATENDLWITVNWYYSLQFKPKN
ncbi:DUF2490 domain-containing protein [Aquimarina spongiae]|uniref:DUF2490 domain-containing protein n=1 Tax=Aquimarina spongiae TaxID=570521 RepID=A0A1M6CMJ1_9FLAO|nr:DUF2490 domain-containing protein [Aquimarina spongiae]SHI62004.1 Protein of unknown function [Aquimarina spongiae]